VGAGAKILGAITIADNSRIGANAVVVKPVPENSVVVGVPGQIVQRSEPHQALSRPDLDHARLPDTIGETLEVLIEHVQQLEARFNGHSIHQHALHAPEHGVWQGQDFSI
jgi:serine O-acetyltransferase